MFLLKHYVEESCTRPNVQVVRFEAMLIKMFAQRICSNLVKNNLQKQFYHIAKHPITITPCLINNCIAIQCPSKPVVQFTTPSRFYAKGKDKKKDKCKCNIVYASKKN